MEQKILYAFLYNHELKFSEIEKLVKTRSNKLAYHIKNLVKKNILIKEGESYKLTETAEYMIPFLSKKKNILPVILIHLGISKKAVFYKRNKRPFKDKLSLPGGRIMIKEDIKSATKRIMKEKFNIKATLKQIHSASIEHIKSKDRIIQTDLVIFVSAKTKDKIEYTEIEKNKKEIIPSDYKLIKNDLDKEIKIGKFVTKD